MIYSKLINKVLKFTHKAHEGAVDQGGIPYVFHPLAVAEQMDDENSTLLALLHDVVEDTEYTFEDIKGLGVSDEVIDALKLMTHNKDEFYFDYINKIKTNPLATKVKLADLKHNSDLTRTEETSEYDLKRLKKYNKATDVLTAQENDVICFDDIDVPNENLEFVIILARYKNKWVFCKREKTDKWCFPSGQRLASMFTGYKFAELDIYDTANRVLFKTTGAYNFELEKIGTYLFTDKNIFGTLYYADIKRFAPLSLGIKKHESNYFDFFEIEEATEKIEFFDKLPENVAYSENCSKLLSDLIEKRLKIDSIKKKGIDAFEHKRIKEAIDILLPLANEGDAESQFILSRIYYENDKNKAVLLAEKAAQKGCVNAYWLLYSYYSDKEDKEKSSLWYRKAIKAEKGKTLYILGKAYLSSEKLGVDYTKAIELLKSATKEGNIDALYKLGYCYENGLGEEKNVKVAISYYKEAAEYGINEAIERLKELKIGELD